MLRLAVAVMALGFAPAIQAANPWGLKQGKPELKSAGQLTFGPDGILFVGDSMGSAIFAIETGDIKGNIEKASYQIDNLREQLTKAFAGTPEIVVNDLAVNPYSGNVYLSISKGGEKTPALAKIDSSGTVTELKLDDVSFSKASLPNPPEDKVVGNAPWQRNLRNDTVTDLAYVEGKLLVAGLTSGTGTSKVREVPFPFSDGDSSVNVEIYHAAHGKVEDYAAIRTFVPLNVNGEASLLAGFTCTPLVKIPIKALEKTDKVRGTTVAELGNMNQPLDMIAYEKGGKRFLLMANSRRGVMKISTENLEKNEGLSKPVSGGGTAGQPFETIKDLEGTVQLDRLNDLAAVVIVANNDQLALKTVALP